MSTEENYLKFKSAVKNCPTIKKFKLEGKYGQANKRIDELKKEFRIPVYCDGSSIQHPSTSKFKTHVKPKRK